MSRFLNEAYMELAPYVPGEQPGISGFIKLNTNESPYPPSPAVVAAITQKAAKELRLYSDPEGALLRQALGSHFGLKKENVALGNGSDELLAFCFMIFQNQERKIYFPAISYGFYPVYAEVYGGKAQELPLGKDFQIDHQDYKNLDGTIVIANPNAPTGMAISRGQIEEILKTNPGNLVIIDEAYVDFGGESAVPLLKKYDNLLVIQTFSKSRSLAGARIGFALGSPEIIDDLNKIRYSFNPYNLNRLSLLAGEAAIKDNEYFQGCRVGIMKTREFFNGELLKLGFSVLPSCANFVFAKHSRFTGQELLGALRERNILVRHFSKPEICDYIRITIGTREQMEACCLALGQILE